LTTVLTTVWAIFGDKRRTTGLCRNADLAYLCDFSGRSDMPQHM
jgi:hypothetical protein